MPSRPRAPRIALLAVLAVTIALPAAAHAAAPAAPATWQDAAPLPAAVAEGVAVPLPDGDALFAGGVVSASFPATTAIAAAERYHAASNSWSPAGTMSAARMEAAAVVLRDGSVLVVGGNDGNGVALASAERWDPDTNSWSSAGTMATARENAVATLLPDGSVLVAGGSQGSIATALASAERWDPSTNAWSPAGSMATARTHAVAARLPDGTVLVAGGDDGGAPATSLASAERYDPATSSWSAVAPMGQVRSEASATTLADGSVLVVGGTGASLAPAVTAERYDAADNSWTPTGGLVAELVGGGVATLPSGLVFAAGGNGGAQLYDPATDAWYPVFSQTLASAGAVPVPLGDGSFLLAGGFAGLEPTSVAQRFTLVTQADSPPLSFGDETVGRAGPVLTAPVYVSGEAPLFTTTARIEGPDAGDFSIQYDRCGDRVVIPGGQCLLGVRFAPTAAGVRRASVAIAADVPGGSVTIPVSGAGVAAPVAPAPPAPVVVTKVVTKLVRAKLPRVRCSAHRGKRVTCTGLAAKTSAGRGAAAVRLTRGKTLYATGTIKRGKLTLDVKRKLVAQHYLLTLVKARKHVKVALA